jgi:hypothetical protein
MNDIRAPLRCFVFLTLIVTVPGLFAQEAAVQIPAGTPLPVQLGKHVPMKKGEMLECHLMYPVYAKNKVAIPAGSILRGSVVALHSDRTRRIRLYISTNWSCPTAPSTQLPAAMPPMERLCCIFPCLPQANHIRSSLSNSVRPNSKPKKRSHS